MFYLFMCIYIYIYIYTYMYIYIYIYIYNNDNNTDNHNNTSHNIIRSTTDMLVIHDMRLKLGTVQTGIRPIFVLRIFKFGV